VIRKPELDSPAQAPEPSVAPSNDASIPEAPAIDEQQDPTAPASVPPDVSPAEAEAVGSKDQDPEFRSFVDTGRSKLEAIDDLLKQEGTN